MSIDVGFCDPNDPGENKDINRSENQSPSDSDDSVIRESNDADGRAEIFQSSSEVHPITKDDATESSDAQETAHEDLWSDLPSPCVSGIYSFLSRNDRYRMSLTCKSWSEKFASPNLWKTFKFFLPEHECESSVCPEVRFSRKYGSMFRNVEVVCKKVRNNMLVPIEEQLILFLESLEASAQLKSIKFSYLHNFLRNVDDSVRERIVTAMEAFFHSQNRLRDVEFHDCLFLTQESTKLVTALFHNDNRSVQNLTLNQFVANTWRPDMAEGSISISPEVCDKFLDLHTLRSDYTRYLEDVLLCLYSSQPSPRDRSGENRARNLSLIKLTCNGNKRQHFRGIPASAWEHLKSACPDLEVEFDFYGGMRDGDIEFFLVKHMPVRKLDVRLLAPHALAAPDIGHLFRHLAESRISAELVSLKVFWGGSAPDFAGELVPFLQQCPKLENLLVTVHHPAGCVEDVFRSFQERRPKSLTSFSLLVVCFGSQEACDGLLALNEKYYPIMRDLELGMFLLAVNLGQ